MTTTEATTRRLDLDVVRTRAVALEYRADEPNAEDIGVMSGFFSVFDEWYEVNSLFEGNFLERVAPGAFARTITEDARRMKVQYNHGQDSRFGSMLLGVPSLVEERDTGPYFEVPLFDTSYNRDLLPGLRAGAYGSSFRFRVMEDGDTWVDSPGRSDHNPQGIPERTVTNARVFEFGPVPYPANPEATAALRSGTDAFYDYVRAMHPTTFSELVTKRGLSLDDLPNDDKPADTTERHEPEGEPDAPSAEGESNDEQNEDEGDTDALSASENTDDERGATTTGLPERQRRARQIVASRMHARKR
jgi:HK97 family phage prohead protease